MSEIILSLVIVALLIYIALKERLVSQERSKLVNAIIAKNAQEAIGLATADSAKPQPPKPPELIPSDSLTDDQWEKVVAEIH